MRRASLCRRHRRRPPQRAGALALKCRGGACTLGARDLSKEGAMSGRGFASRRIGAAVALAGVVAAGAVLGGGALASHSAPMRFAVLATGTPNDANWGQAWYQRV